MRIVLNTNVLVSGNFFTGPPASILAAWASRRFELIASVEVLVEYRRVGARLGRRYPLRPATFAALRSRGRDVARAELLHGGRQLTLGLQGLPFGGMVAPGGAVASYGTD